MSVKAAIFPCIANIAYIAYAMLCVAAALMLYREIMAVCSEVHTKHTHTLCGQNVELLNVKQAVHIVTTGL